MNRSNNTTAYQLIIMLIAFFAIVSCTKEPDKIGLDLQPPGERIGILRTDTVTVTGYSIREDSVRTDERAVATNVIGSFFDPVFGKTNASVYTEFLMTTVNLSFGGSPIIDSIFLNLAYAGLYGDSATSQTFRVFEMSENIHYDSTYYSNRSVSLTGDQELGVITFVPNVKDSVMIGSVKKAPHLRMRLNQNLAQKLLAGSTDDFSSNAKFKSFFKGIYIAADPITTSGKGALINFNFFSSLTSIDVHYQNSEKDSLKYSFAATFESARFNRYDHNYADADPLLRRQIIDGDTTAGGQKIFLQPFGGVKAKIRIPYLKEWSKLKNVVINEAQLILTNADPTGTYGFPYALVTARIVDASNRYVLLEDQYEGESYYGGTYNTSSNTIRIRHSLYVQKQILQKYKDDFGLILLIPDASVNPQRAVLHGHQASTGRISMVITYSFFE
ncbi:MAG: DUF4270 domain-containing protein [Bacteroidales bacterium]|nr:DUF4270 domain-containing protein [Bacteroidales bacterium]MDZ4203309.1 DUF4270 domain-containing protein [Bacteroidales bacterium]